MTRNNINGLGLWQFENLSREPSIKHFVTDRDSERVDQEFTLSLSSLPDKKLVQENRASLAEAIGVTPDRLIFPSQVHKTNIVNVTSSISREALMETDALITGERGLCICVMSADCVPILIYDRRNHVAAAVHSGWRGTVAKILTKTLEQLADQFGTRGEDIIAGIGPSVSQENYEVGGEVIIEVTKAFDGGDHLMIAKENGKAHLDLWKANHLQLTDFGVVSSNIEISNLCTVGNNQHFFSARKGDSGRFAAGICLL